MSYPMWTGGQIYLQTVSKQICQSQNIQPMANSLYVNPFLNKPLFLCACSADFLKHSGKRRNCFVTSNFLIFLQCSLPFSRTFCHFSSYLKLSFANPLTFSQISSGFTCLLYNCLKVRKGEIACIEHFLLFLHCFLPFIRTSRHFHQI